MVAKLLDALKPQTLSVKRVLLSLFTQWWIAVAIQQRMRLPVRVHPLLRPQVAVWVRLVW